MRKILGVAVLACVAISCDKVEKNITTASSDTAVAAGASGKAHGMGVSTCGDCHSWNIVQAHDSDSTAYNSDCISCHGDMSDEASLSSAVQGIHPLMCPYVYQAAGQTSMTNTVCVYCHEDVDLEGNPMGSSAGNLRKQVAASKCVTCHTAAGPGRQLYQ